MSCHDVGGAMICAYPEYKIRLGSKVHTFSIVPSCGACVDGDPGPRSLIWWALDIWNVQGQQIDADGYCVWWVPFAPDIDDTFGPKFSRVEHEYEDGGWITAGLTARRLVTLLESENLPTASA